MELILLACSDSKLPGGTNHQSPSPSRLPSLLDSASYQLLLDSRRLLAEMLQLSRGHDLGSDQQEQDIPLLPAYRRYSGRVYRRAGIAEAYPGRADKDLLIVSALYGIVEGQDYIRAYNLEMNDKLPNGQRVGTWWKGRGLNQIVRGYIHAARPTIVHDFLTEPYRLATQSHKLHLDGIEIRRYEYPGLRQGASYHRGDDVARLLNQA